MAAPQTRLVRAKAGSATPPNPRNASRLRRRRPFRPGPNPRAGQGRASRCSPPAPASLCSTPSSAATRLAARCCASASPCRPPPPARRILRLRADEAALRDLRFAVTDEPGPAAGCMDLWRDLVRRPPTLDGRRLARAAALLDLALPDPDGLAARLKDCAGQGDPVSAAARAAAARRSRPSPRRADARLPKCSPCGSFDLVLAVRLRWERPLPLIAAKILDPSLRPPGADRRPQAGRAGMGENRRGGDRSRRGLGARSRRRPVAPGRHPAHRCSKAPRQTGDENRRHAARRGCRRAQRSGARGKHDRPLGAPAVRTLIKLGAVRELSGRPSLPDVRPVSAASRRRRRDSEEHFDAELADLPLAARWREWMLRVEAGDFRFRRNRWRARRWSAWSAKAAGSTI